MKFLENAKLKSVGTNIQINLIDMIKTNVKNNCEGHLILPQRLKNDILNYRMLF